MIEGFQGFIHWLEPNAGMLRQTGHNYYRLDPVLFIIYYSSYHSALCILSYSYIR